MIADNEVKSSSAISRLGVAGQTRSRKAGVMATANADTRSSPRRIAVFTVSDNADFFISALTFTGSLIMAQGRLLESLC